MARDYKSRAAPRKKTGNQPSSCGAWFLGGVLAGLFICSLAWLKFGAGVDAPSRPVQTVQKKKTAPKQEKKSSKAATPASKPRFDFYTILPEMEVVVPDPEPEPVKTSAGKMTTSDKSLVTSATTADYMLQMGSFRKYADADRLKASLALVGLGAEIQKIKLAGEGTFHRVRSGPYTQGQVNKLRKKLTQNRISSLVIKLRK